MYFIFENYSNHSDFGVETTFYKSENMKDCILIENVKWEHPRIIGIKGWELDCNGRVMK